MKLSPQQVWNTRYIQSAAVGKTYSPWLERWREYLVGNKALDIGCGVGFDTEKLNEYGFDVTAIDISAEALKKSHVRNPRTRHLKRDLSRGIDLRGTYFSVIVANLSLHYFSRTVTLHLIQEIWQLLDDKGMFLFRVNAFGDANYGCPETIDGWELVAADQVSKQFFTREKIIEMLQGRFRILSLEQLEDARYGKTKRLYECVAVKESA